MELTQKLAALQIVLPPSAGPFGSYIPAKKHGDLIYVAGQLPRKDDKLIGAGPVPSQCSIETAQVAARQCVINALAAVATLGPAVLDSVNGVLRVGAFVQSDVDFHAQPQVANAASELLQQIFGASGQHVRAAVGVNTLPLNGSVEIEFIFTTASGQ